MKKIGTWILICAAGAALFSCSKNPVTGKHELHMISEKEELALGDHTKQQIVQEYGLYVNPTVQSYVNEVGQKVVAVCERKNLPYDFVILDTPLVNAFSVPGHIFITRGILDLIDDEAELAAVLGHEIGHVTNFHVVKLIQKAFGYQVLSMAATVAVALYGPRADDPRAYAVLNQATNLVADGFLMGYGRDFELEADRSGLRYAVLAGYDPDAMVSFFKRMKSIGEEKATGIGIFLRSHPPTDDRIKQIKKILADYSESPRKSARTKTEKKVVEVLKSTAAFADNFQRYQDVMKSVPKAKLEEPGVVKGNSYDHSALGVHLETPKDWKLEMVYGKSLVSFRKSDGKAQGELQMIKIDPEPTVIAEKNSGTAGVAASTELITSREWAESIEEGFKMKKRSGRDVTYPAGPAYVGTYTGIDRLGRPAFFKVLYIVRGIKRDKLEGFIIFCGAPGENYLDYLIDFERIMQSLSFSPPKKKEQKMSGKQ